MQLWYGFRVRKPKENLNASNDNTFTQIKQVTKIRNANEKINCSKGVVFHMNTDGFAYNGDGLNYPGKKQINDIITSKWTAYKIGIKFSYGPDGWIKLFQNGSLVWFDNGPNLITKFYSNCSKDKIDLFGNHLRIGVYAKSQNKEV